MRFRLIFVENYRVLDQNFSSKIFENFEKMKKYLKRKSRKNSKSRTQRLESKMSKVEIEERKEISIFVLCKHLYSLIQQHVMVFNRPSMTYIG